MLRLFRTYREPRPLLLDLLRGEGEKGGNPLPLAGGPPRGGSLRTLQRLQGLRGGSGFTLVELMVVVGIMALLTGMAVLTFRGNADRQAVTQTRIRIARFLSEARGVALSRGLPVAVYLNPARGTITSFLWADSILNFRLDWNDLNFDGLMDPGEGEVLLVYERIQINTGRGEGMGGRRLRFLEVPPAFDPQAQPVGCNLPASSFDPNPEPNLVVFTPTGNILNSEGYLCADYVVYIQLTQASQPFTSKIRVRPSGFVESYDIFG